MSMNWPGTWPSNTPPPNVQGGIYKLATHTTELLERVEAVVPGNRLVTDVMCDEPGGTVRLYLTARDWWIVKYALRVYLKQVHEFCNIPPPEFPAEFSAL